MNNSVRLGFGIAALFAVGVFVVSVFGNHQSWFVRAAQANAVQCMTASSCPRIDAKGAITNARPPLSPTSPCAKPHAWTEVKAVSNGQTRLVLTCTDGRAFLYHMGRLAGPVGGTEQWMACAEPQCGGEITVLAKAMLP